MIYRWRFIHRRRFFFVFVIVMMHFKNENKRQILTTK